ncbi:MULTISPECIES: helix-turn-helix domain-containing protein [Bacillus]|nr:helix-turn-helix transcriptional regulator [Bacillus sp. BLCC1-0148]MDD7777977.1 helix-turn-helix transcriptional regulator [Bacillus sp. BLCC1-0148]PEB82837.1 transcriptional regulator [Bacillus cereus]PFH80450.1 transcriptional regulator [Bacillus cereus]
MSEYFVDIKKLMSRESCSLPVLADKVGVNKGHLSQLMNGKSATLKTVNKIMNALEITDINEVLSVKTKK